MVFRSILSNEEAVSRAGEIGAIAENSSASVSGCKGPTLAAEPSRKLPIVSAVRLLTATFYPVNIRPLLRLRFAAIRSFSGHVAGVVMILARLLFARLLLIWILIAGH